MPTQSPQLSDPSHWENPPVPEEWWPVIRNHLPAYDPQVTPAFWMGKVADTFRTFPGVLRSDHPKLSLAAWGKEAGEVVADHGLAFSLGENSPLAKLYDRSAHVLLLGVGYESNTSFHLAEYRVPGGKVIEEGAPVMEKGGGCGRFIRTWITKRTCSPPSAKLLSEPILFKEAGSDWRKAGCSGCGKLSISLWTGSPGSGLPVEAVWFPSHCKLG